MAKKNSINNVTQDLTVDPGASGDSFVQFDINTTGEFRVGVDDDASDAFKISQGSALGTNDTFIITDQGEITKPLQPAFLATIETQQTDVTGASVSVNVVFDTEVFDQGGDFISPTFTAPIAGRYLFQACMTYGDLGSVNTGQVLIIDSSNIRYRSAQTSPAAMRTVNDENSANLSVFADLDVADTAFVRIQVILGTQIVDFITNGASDPLGWFSGSLQC